MQGSVLNVGADTSLILGDDGIRYTFVSAEWLDSNAPPKVGTRVDFEVRGSVAVDIYPVPDASPFHDVESTRSPASSSAQPDTSSALPASTTPSTGSARGSLVDRRRRSSRRSDRRRHCVSAGTVHVIESSDRH